MKRIIFSLFVVSAFISVLNAQIGYYKWAHAYDFAGNSGTSDICVNDSNYVFAAINFNGTLDADPSHYSVNYASNGSIKAAIVKYDEHNNLMWSSAFGIGTSSNVKINEMKLESNSFIYVSGYFSGSFDADPGPAVTTLVSSGNYDFFVLKMNQQGQLVWALAAGGANNDEAKSLTSDDNGNIYIAGIFSGTFDSDPGIGTASLTSNSWPTDIAIIKLDSNLNFKWSFKVGDYGSEDVTAIHYHNGVLDLFGRFANTVDFDPGPGTTTLMTNNGGFTARYDTSSTFKSVHPLTGIASNIINSVNLGYDKSKYLLTGNFSQTFDADPSPSGTFTLSGNSNEGYFILLDTSLQFVSAFQSNSITTVGDCNFRAAMQDASSDIYVTGNFNKSVDFDPGAGSTVFTAGGGLDYDFFIAKYTAGSAFLGAFEIENANMQNTYAITLDNRGYYYVGGSTAYTTDFDASASTKNFLLSNATEKAFIAKYGPCASIQSLLYDTICRNSNYIFGGKALNESGTYINTVFLSGACDSVVTLNLNVQSVVSDVFVSNNNLIAKDSSVFDSLQWVNCNSSQIVSVNSAVYVPQDNQSYALVASQDGCSDTSECFFMNQNASCAVPVLDWVYKWNGNFTNHDHFQSVDKLGNLYLTGFFDYSMDIDVTSGVKEIPAYSDDIFLAKLKNNGYYEWAVPATAYNLSATQEQGNSVYIDDQQNVYVTGEFQADTDFNPAQDTSMLKDAAGGCCVSNTFVVKYNSSGQPMWKIGFGTTNASIIPYSIAVSKTGQVAVCGLFAGTVDVDPGPGVVNIVCTNGDAAFLVTYSSSGQYLNNFVIDGTSFNDAISRSVVFDGNDNIILTGQFAGTRDFDPGTGIFNLTANGTYTNTFIARYSSSLQLKWAKRFGGTGTTEFGAAVAVDGDDNVYLAGNAYGSVNFTGGSGGGYSVSGVYLVQYDSTGFFNKRYTLSASNSSQRSMGLAIDNARNIYLSSDFSGTGFSYGSNTVNAPGNSDYSLVVKYKEDGTACWGFILGTIASNETATGLSVDANGNVFVSGRVDVGTDFDLSANSYNLPGIGVTNFIAKYGQDCSPINTGATVGVNSITATATNCYYIWKDCSTDSIVDTTLTNIFQPWVAGNYKAIIYQGACVDSTACYFTNGNPTAGINEMSSEALVVFPNPGKSYLTVSVAGATGEICKVTVYDVNGKKCNVETSSIEKDVILNIGTLNPGVFIIEAEMKNGNFIRRNFIKVN